MPTLSRGPRSGVFFVLLASGLLLVLGACTSAENDPSTTFADSAGVTLVTGPGGDLPLEWTAIETMRIAPLDDEGDGFFTATTVTVLEGDRIAVLDADAKRVVVYDGAGTFQTQYGREGSGPGEFQWPTNIAARPDGGVSVFDVMNRRVERFDRDLNPLAPNSLHGVGSFGGSLAYTGSFLVLPTVDYEDPESRPQILKAVSASDTLDIVRYEREMGGEINLESCGMRFAGLPPVFSPTTRWTTGSDGAVLVMGTGSYELDLYRAPGFGLERRIRRNLPVIRATQELAEADIGDGMRVMIPGGERVCDPGEVVSERGFAPEVPPTTQVAVSRTGEIFIQRWAPEGEEQPIDVLTSEGEYVGTLAPGFPFPRAFLSDGRFVVTEEDELELRSVVVYQLQR